MKSIMLLFMIGIAAIQTVIGQDITIPAPEFNRKVMFLKKNNTLSDLDKTDLSRVQKDKLMPAQIKMFSGYKFYIKADGCCASVAHSGKPTERFIVKVEAGIDPSDIVQLYKFEVKNDTRLLLTNKVTMGSALNDNSGQLKSIKLDFKKVADGVYFIIHEEQLDDGEYVFICGSMAHGTGMSTSAMANQQYERGFCFSVNNSDK